jgi:hypothetical protein
MFPAATCMQTRVRQSFHIRLQVHRTCFIAQYFYRADIATKSYRVLSAVCVVLDSGSALRQVETCGRELFKAPQRELHYGGRCTSNQWQSQLGFCLKICMLIRNDWSDKRGTCQRDRQRGQVLGSGSAEEGAQGPRYERRSGPAWVFQRGLLQQGKSCWRASSVHSVS